MEIYVVVVDCHYDFESFISVEIFEDIEKARKYMLEQFENEIEDKNYDKVEREENSCVAYDNGYFVENHCEITISKKNIIK